MWKGFRSNLFVAIRTSTTLPVDLVCPIHSFGLVDRSTSSVSEFMLTLATRENAVRVKNYPVSEGD